MNLPQVVEIKISYHPDKGDKPVMKTSKEAHNFFKGFFMGETICLQEQFAAMYLNRANKVLGVTILSKGGITGTGVDIRLLLCIALNVQQYLSCYANHPSGNLQPSKAEHPEAFVCQGLSLQQSVLACCSLLPAGANGAVHSCPNHHTYSSNCKKLLH